MRASARRAAEKYQRLAREEAAYFDNPEAGMSRELLRDFQVDQFQMAKRLAREFGIGFTFERRRWQFSETPWSVPRHEETAELRRFRRVIEHYLGMSWAEFIRRLRAKTRHRRTAVGQG